MQPPRQAGGGGVLVRDRPADIVVAAQVIGEGRVGQRAGARRGAGLAGVAARVAAALPVPPALAFFAGGCASGCSLAHSSVAIGQRG